MTTILHILGDWSRNIGNAFFQLGGQYVLQKTCPDARIGIIAEQTGYPSYWNPKGGNPENSFDLVSNMEADYLVLMGPMFRPEIEKIWGASLSKILAKGTRLICLGVGAMNYEDRYIEEYRKFMEKFQPYIFTSRDQETFQKLGDLAIHSYDGIDFGFFMSDVYQPIGFGQVGQKILALNFDKLPEPEIKLSKNPGTNIRMKDTLDRSFLYEGNYWTVEFPVFRTRLSKYSRYTMFLEGLLFSGNNIHNIGDYMVIRSEHRPHPMLRKKTFRYPNVVVNDTPYVYAEIYSQADLTLSTRVHASVLALSYGKPSLLFSNTPRVRLLNRVGVSEITSKPMRLKKDYLDKEKTALIEFIRGYL